MLILTRRENESINIGDNIKVTLTRINEHAGSGQVSVRIGTEAPAEVEILRKELVGGELLVGSSTRREGTAGFPPPS